MISRPQPVIGSVPFLVPPGKKQPETRKPERNTSNRQKHQLPTRRATATSRHSRARQKFSESGPTSLRRGSWNEMPAATGKCELHQTWSLDTEATTPPDTVPFSSTRTLARARDARPDIPPTARNGESWNVMPAARTFQAGMNNDPKSQNMNWSLKTAADRTQLKGFSSKYPFTLWSATGWSSSWRSADAGCSPAEQEVPEPDHLPEERNESATRSL